MSQKQFKGVKNYLLKEGELLNFTLKKLSKIAEKRFYSPTYTSLINNKSIYQNTLGKESEIINKELFLLKNEIFCLRPEGTANIMNSLLKDNHLKFGKFPLKLFYNGEMFRYERPQKGRYRQFYQFGAELICDRYDVCDDIEILEFCNDVVCGFGLRKDVVLNVNFIGGFEERGKYNEYIKGYFRDNCFLRDYLEDSSKKILENNAIRLLDTKNENEIKIVNKLEKLENFLSGESLDKFEKIKNYLDQRGIRYKVNKNLVRGLDYYNDLCFEYQIKDNENRMNTILGGGRYDGLIGKLDKKMKVLPGVGFALGIDRMLDHFRDKIIDIKNKELDNKKFLGIFISDLDYNEEILVKINKLESFFFQKNYRILKIKSSFKKFGKEIKNFEEKGIEKIIIIGNDEINTKTLIIRNIKNKTQEKVAINFSNIDINI